MAAPKIDMLVLRDAVQMAGNSVVVADCKRFEIDISADGQWLTLTNRILLHQTGGEDVYGINARSETLEIPVTQIKYLRRAKPEVKAK